MRCEGEMCPCFETPNETCTVDLCCKMCIEAKIKATQKATIARLNSGGSTKVTCTCKKTRCVKKYCTCFASGNKCGPECSCEDCLNCDPV